MKYLPLDTAGGNHAGYQQQVKEGNIKRIFDLVRSGKCKSRAELVRVMNLSATSVSVLVEELAARRLIDETGPSQTSLPGRRPISLRLNGDAHQLAVFMLWPDGVRYTLLNLECQVLESEFFPLDSARSSAKDGAERYIQLLGEILSMHAPLFDASRALAAGICFPGIYDQSERLLHCQTTLGFSIPEEAILQLQQRIQLPVYLLNDTMSLAYAEKKCLDASDPENPETLDLLYVEVGHRIGSAIIARGNIYTGPYNVSGQIGHFTIDYKGLPCPCGNVGCLERYVNLNAILEDAQRACASADTEPPESFEALARRYPEEPVLRDSVAQSAKLLAFGLYSLMCSSGMRRIVLGGGIEALGDPFLQEVYRAVCSRTLLIHHLDLSYAQAGSDAESVGLAQYFLDKVFTITS